jgi:hypothetical protein
MFRGFRRTATAAVAVVALGAGGAAWAASSASAAPAGPAAISKCAASNLAAWVNADSADGTAGTTYFNLDFTNTGRVTCYLDGYPGVSATGPGGGQLGRAARRNSFTPARVIDLAPGATAHSYLGYVDIVVDPTCRPATATFLKVYAPNDTVAKHAFFPVRVCTNGTVDLTVQRVAAGV